MVFVAMIVAVSSIVYASSTGGGQLQKASSQPVQTAVQEAESNFTLAAIQGSAAISEASSYQQSTVVAHIATLAAQLATETDPQKRAAITAQIQAWSQLSSLLDQLSSQVQTEYGDGFQPLSSSTGPSTLSAAADDPYLVTMTRATAGTGATFAIAFNASLLAAGNLTQALQSDTAQQGGPSIADMMRLQQQMNLLEMSANLGSSLLSTMAKQLIDLQTSSSALLQADRTSYLAQALNTTVAKAATSSINMTATAQLLQTQIIFLTAQLGNITAPSDATPSDLAQMSRQMASINTRLSILNQALQTLNSEIHLSVSQAESL